MERIIKHLLAFMWFTWLIDIASTVLGLNMGNFFVELNPLFHTGGWILMIGVNFILRCATTAIVIVIYKWRPTSYAMAIYIAGLGFLGFGSTRAVSSNLSLIIQLLLELKGG